MPDAQGFNAWHADVARSSVCQQIFQRALGLPPEFPSNSLLTWDAIASVTEALRLSPGQAFADLACGRGGYSQEVARRTGARLVGLDFSEVAVTIAHAAARGVRGRTRFCVGDYTAVGLRDNSVDAVMCIDAIQFSDPPLAAMTECRRILASGGRLVITAWEPTEPVDSRLPERTQRMNLARELATAGFSHVDVSSRPDWYQAERRLWEAAIEADSDGDSALMSLQEEGTRALETFAVKRRVCATAIAP